MQRTSPRFALWTLMATLLLLTPGSPAHGDTVAVTDIERRTWIDAYLRDDQGEVNLDNLTVDSPAGTGDSWWEETYLSPAGEIGIHGSSDQVLNIDMPTDDAFHIVGGAAVQTTAQSLMLPQDELFYHEASSVVASEIRFTIRTDKPINYTLSLQMHTGSEDAVSFTLGDAFEQVVAYGDGVDLDVTGHLEAGEHEVHIYTVGGAWVPVHGYSAGEAAVGFTLTGVVSSPSPGAAGAGMAMLTMLSLRRKPRAMRQALSGDCFPSQVQVFAITRAATSTMAMSACSPLCRFLSAA